MHRFDLPTTLEKIKILEYGEAITEDIKALELVRITPSVDETKLPFSDFYFDYALSLNYFFTNETQKDLQFHIERLRELTRVSKEVRIFPINTSLLGPLLLLLQQENYGTAIYHINHNSNKDNAMLKVWAQLCRLS